jgi:2-polyprenyl-3-methyl-5-hydroxy-6-metoxy-1,4-benzoquinol methylase
MATNRIKLWQLLDNPVIWEVSRWLLNLVFSLYRKRFQVMQKYGLLKDNPSILDIGCGIGQYANMTKGNYLGVDMNERYIDYARERNQRPNQSFRCTDVTTVLNEKSKFDLVLMVDFLHHISDQQCVDLLNIASKLANNYVVSFEPITYQPNSVGRWIVENDRGDYVRPLDKLHKLFEESRLDMIESKELRLGPINTRFILACPPKSNQASS